MKYKLIKAISKDIENLESYKLRSILPFMEQNKEEIAKVRRFVKNNTVKQLENYKMINIGKETAGCLLVTEFKDGVLLDEIFIEEKYRNLGIGTSLINEVLNKNKTVYLWVYKSNDKAINLYKRLGFTTCEDTDTRLLMIFSTN